MGENPRPPIRRETERPGRRDHRLQTGCSPRGSPLHPRCHAPPASHERPGWQRGWRPGYPPGLPRLRRPLSVTPGVAPRSQLPVSGHRPEQTGSVTSSASVTWTSASAGVLTAPVLSARGGGGLRGDRLPRGAALKAAAPGCSPAGKPIWPPHLFEPELSLGCDACLFDLEHASVDSLTRQLGGSQGPSRY